VPARSAGSFLVRAREDAYLDELKERVLDCFTAGATATGAELKYKWDDARYATMKNNMVMAGLFLENMRRLGRNPVLRGAGEGYGSTDMGNVSHIVPTIQPYVSVGIPAPIHTAEFAQAARSAGGKKEMLDAAKAMAMTAVDLLTEPLQLDAAKREFADS
jgi:metal-dependent amidase/aminoacylase/carboxypeptidase family protein